jgi:hypothetical protein
MSVIIIVRNPVGRSLVVDFPARFRSDSIWLVMNPTGTMPYFFAAFSSRLRARSFASSFSNETWLKRDSAFRTCDSSLIGSRRRPRESTYANALSGRFAR